MRSTVLCLALCVSGLAGCDQATAPPMNSGTQRAAAPDNTATNARDRSDQVKTPIDQNENQADIDITAGIRKRVEAFDGTVTLSSPPGGPTELKVELPCGS